MMPDKFPGLATATTLMKKVANKYPNKAAVGVNASGFVSCDTQKNSGFNCYLAKSNKAWNYTPVTPVVIYEEKVKRDLSTSKMPNTDHITYGLKKDGYLNYYSYYNGSDVNKNVNTSTKLKNEGVKYTFGFFPLLVYKGEARKNLAKNNDIRQGLCQVDKHNFILYTNISDNRNRGFSFNSLAKQMLNDKCFIGVNLDGGGSTNLLYKKKDNKSITGVRTTSRSIGDIIYFYGD